MRRGLVLVCLSLAWPAQAAPITVMAEACFACHGTDGQSAGAIPAFSTDSPEELRKALHDFRSGAREATIMDRIVRGYTEDEIEAVVSHFAQARRQP